MSIYKLFGNKCVDVVTTFFRDEFNVKFRIETVKTWYEYRGGIHGKSVTKRITCVS